MAVPFKVPDEEKSSSAQNQSEILRNSSSQQSTTPSRPIPISRETRNIQSSPQHSPVVDSEMLVQAVYEAICRCSQDVSNFQSNSPSNSFNRGHFLYPANFSSSNSSSGRNSFRDSHRGRLNSYGSQSQYSENSNNIAYEDDFVDWDQHYQQREVIEDFPRRATQHNNHNQKQDKKQKKSKSENNKSKITNFVINALQFVIDTLK